MYNNVSHFFENLKSNCLKIHNYYIYNIESINLEPIHREYLISLFNEITDDLYKNNTGFYWKNRLNYFDLVSEIWFVLRDNKFIVGWGGCSVYDNYNEKIIYIDTLNIMKQNKRYVFEKYTVGSIIIHEMLSKYRSNFFKKISFAFRSQNPKVYRLGCAILPNKIYPNIYKSKKFTNRSLKVVTYIANILSPNKFFNNETGVILKAYNGNLYGEKVKHFFEGNDPQLTSFWSVNLNIDNGDALVMAVCPSSFESLVILILYKLCLFKLNVLQKINKIIFKMAGKI